MTSNNEKPNILFIISHDVGTEFSCYGGSFETKNFDKFAQKGIRFHNNFSTAPQCSPSRGSIMTGMYPHVNGLMGLTNLAWDLPESNITIPKLLKKNGYSTHLIGMQHEHRDAKTLGYDNISPRWEAPFFARAVNKRAQKFFEKVDNGDIQQPFYCSVGIFETHRPFITGRKFRPKKEDVKIPKYLPETDDIKKEMTKFYGLLGELDYYFGKIMEALEKTTFKENTIVIYTVDHGIPFPRHKCTLYDTGINTALFMYWPGKIEGGKVYSQLISNVDLFPTIMELTNTEIPKDLQSKIQGKSFYPLIMEKQDNQETYNERDYVISEMGFHNHGYNAIRSIRSKEWKYIRNFNMIKGKLYKEITPMLFEIPHDYRNQPSGKGYTETYPEYFSERPEDELYNLIDDPDELNNLAENQEYKNIKEDLKSKLLNELEKTNDPVLKGIFPKKPDKRNPIFI